MLFSGGNYVSHRADLIFRIHDFFHIYYIKHFFQNVVAQNKFAFLEEEDAGGDSNED